MRGDRPLHVAATVAAACAALLVACSPADTSSQASSEAGERGEALLRDRGCAACHGGDWNGGVGPALRGLAGSSVQLDDGTTVTADDAYLTRAITDPAAQKVTGYTIVMPANDLSPEEVADVVAFLRELTPAP